MGTRTETRMYIYQTGTQVFNGWAGFRIGETYQLRVEQREDDIVAVALDYAQVSPGAVLTVLSSE